MSTKTSDHGNCPGARESASQPPRTAAKAAARSFSTVSPWRAQTGVWARTNTASAIGFSTGAAGTSVSPVVSFNLNFLQSSARCGLPPSTVRPKRSSMTKMRGEKCDLIVVFIFTNDVYGVCSDTESSKNEQSFENQCDDWQRRISTIFTRHIVPQSNGC